LIEFLGRSQVTTLNRLFRPHYTRPQTNDNNILLRHLFREALNFLRVGTASLMLLDNRLQFVFIYLFIFISRSYVDGAGELTVVVASMKFWPMK
jgi:hypothetical protein